MSAKHISQQDLDEAIKYLAAQIATASSSDTNFMHPFFLYMGMLSSLAATDGLPSKCQEFPNISMRRITTEKDKLICILSVILALCNKTDPGYTKKFITELKAIEGQTELLSEKFSLMGSNNTERRQLAAELASLTLELGRVSKLDPMVRQLEAAKKSKPGTHATMASSLSASSSSSSGPKRMDLASLTKGVSAGAAGVSGTKLRYIGNKVDYTVTAAEKLDITKRAIVTVKEEKLEEIRIIRDKYQNDPEIRRILNTRVLRTETASGLYKGLDAADNNPAELEEALKFDQTIATMNRLISTYEEEAKTKARSATDSKRQKENQTKCVATIESVLTSTGTGNDFKYDPKSGPSSLQEEKAFELYLNALTSMISECDTIILKLDEKIIDGVAEVKKLQFEVANINQSIQQLLLPSTTPGMAASASSTSSSLTPGFLSSSGSSSPMSASSSSTSTAQQDAAEKECKKLIEAAEDIKDKKIKYDIEASEDIAGAQVKMGEYARAQEEILSKYSQLYSSKKGLRDYLNSNSGDLENRTIKKAEGFIEDADDEFKKLEKKFNAIAKEVTEMAATMVRYKITPVKPEFNVVGYFDNFKKGLETTSLKPR